MQKWEYWQAWFTWTQLTRDSAHSWCTSDGQAWIQVDLGQALNELGAEGWELVDVYVFGNEYRPGTTDQERIYFFKRPVED